MDPGDQKMSNENQTLVFTRNLARNAKLLHAAFKTEYTLDPKRLNACAKIIQRLQEESLC